MVTQLPPETRCGCAPLREAIKAFYKSTPVTLRGLFLTCCSGRVMTVLAETVLQERVEHAPALGGRRPDLLWHTL